MWPKYCYFCFIYSCTEGSGFSPISSRKFSWLSRGCAEALFNTTSQNLNFFPICSIDRPGFTCICCNWKKIRETSLIFVLVVICLSFHILFIAHMDVLPLQFCALCQWNIYPGLISWTPESRTAMAWFPVWHTLSSLKALYLLKSMWIFFHDQNQLCNHLVVQQFP